MCPRCSKSILLVGVANDNKTGHDNLANKTKLILYVFLIHYKKSFSEFLFMVQLNLNLTLTCVLH